MCIVALKMALDADRAYNLHLLTDSLWKGFKLVHLRFVVCFYFVKHIVAYFIYCVEILSNCKQTKIKNVFIIKEDCEKQKSFCLDRFTGLVPIVMDT